MKEKTNCLHVIVEHDEVEIDYPQGKGPVGRDLSLHFHTLNSNNPSANNNYIGLWRSAGNGKIPPNIKALKSYPVRSTAADSNVTLLSLPIDQNEYILGYSQCGDPAATGVNLSATLSIPAGAFNPDNVIANTVKLNIAGNEASIWLTYSVIPNIDAKGMGNWIGLWEDDAVIGQDIPAFSSLLDENGASGKFVLDGLLYRDTTYLLGFFMNGFDEEADKLDCSSLAAKIRFTTDS